ncbi:uncharacterized protein LOC109105551 isoform X2 [Cyprinus carpio]|uniref:Uncharacterized protein LOC109105551 isoform X2 n=1 Tax=Cyprinus carpio TaxID=7962 RepID=A0A9Q9XZE4_CYPCA|nr:uncharacterized protein LOC109105551 isoform X2 [Cyprinus carpio]
MHLLCRGDKGIEIHLRRLKKMIHALVVFFLCFVPLIGVFGAETDETVSAMEGDSFTLRTGLTEIQRDDEIEWRFGSSRTRITRIAAGNITTYSDEKFKNRLQIDRQTGDLTITNITNEHTGVYQLSIIIRNKKSTKRFAVSVYAHVPVPAIFSDTSHCALSAERSSTIFLCSVLNVEYQDSNTYCCVVNNPVSNQTTHLDISKLCQIHSDCDLCFDSPEAVIRLVVTALISVAAVAAVVLLVNDVRRIGRSQTMKR